MPNPVAESSVAAILAGAAHELAHVTETPRLDAEILLAHALCLPRAALLARLRDRAVAPGFEALVQRRAAAEPLAYILGEWEFQSLPFEVVQPLLVPRPETEHLVEAVAGFSGTGQGRVLEIGTGTGCVAIAIAYAAPRCRVVATDINPLAIETAARNAGRHGVADRVAFRQGDLFEALGEDDGPFDVVCSNPPYVEDDAWPELSPTIRLYEDPKALLAGKDGLDVVRRIARGALACLKPGGLLALEIGTGQRAAVEGLLEQHGYAEVQFRQDLAGLDRIALAHARNAFDLAAG